jgi:microcystin-dependent protein
MSEPFLAEIKIVGFTFAPRGWAFCDGQILPINQYQSLYSLLGTTYGGDGRTTFGLPDLRGRTPIHEGNGHYLGQKGGEERHTLNEAEMPNHTHAAQASADEGTSNTPSGNVPATVPSRIYRNPTNLTALRTGTVGNVGTGQGHENMQPFLALSFCIALQGLFPPRN